MFLFSFPAGGGGIFFLTREVLFRARKREKKIGCFFPVFIFFGVFVLFGFFFWWLFLFLFLFFAR